jgi:hypothetical protein
VTTDDWPFSLVSLRFFFPASLHAASPVSQMLLSTSPLCSRSRAQEVFLWHSASRSVPVTTLPVPSPAYSFACDRIRFHSGLSVSICCFVCFGLGISNYIVRIKTFVWLNRFDWFRKFKMRIKALPFMDWVFILRTSWIVSPKISKGSDQIGQLRTCFSTKSKVGPKFENISLLGREIVPVYSLSWVTQYVTK